MSNHCIRVGDCHMVFNTIREQDKKEMLSELNKKRSGTEQLSALVIFMKQMNPMFQIRGSMYSIPKDHSDFTVKGLREILPKADGAILDDLSSAISELITNNEQLYVTLSTFPNRVQVHEVIRPWPVIYRSPK